MPLTDANQKMKKSAKDNRVIQQLKEDFNGRLKELNTINPEESVEATTTNLVEKFTKLMCSNSEARFPETTCATLESFGIFDIECPNNVIVTFVLRV